MPHYSRVLVRSVLGPSRANVNDEADQERKHKVQDGDDDPLAYAQLMHGGNFKVIVVDLLGDSNRVVILLLWHGEVTFIAVVRELFILAFEQAVVVLGRNSRHNIINTSE